MIEVKVTRKVQSYTLESAGSAIVNLNWEILLECGHKVRKLTSYLIAERFQTEFSCGDCERMATRDLERFHMAVAGER